MHQLLIALVLAASQPASAGECNSRLLQRELDEATPYGVGKAYKTLADCDPEAAKVLATSAFERVLPGEPGELMLVPAIQVGATNEARTWIARLQSDDRSRAIKSLGPVCQDDDAVAGFLMESSRVVPDEFWEDRWYRAMCTCRRPEVQDLLRKEIQDPSGNRNRYLGVLEVFAQNMRKDAIPYLKTAFVLAKDEDEVTFVINAFADAAGVGSWEGQDPEATEAAIQAILELAPQMPARAVVQARTTLTALGAPERSGPLAAALYQADKHPDGNLHYGVVAVETATCRNGKNRVAFHRGDLVEPGRLWPEDLLPQVHDLVMARWTFEQADKCRGTAEIQVTTTERPLGPTALPAWYAEKLKVVQKQSEDKVIEVDEEPVFMGMAAG